MTAHAIVPLLLAGSALFVAACGALGSQNRARAIETGVAGTVEAESNLAGTVAAQVEATVTALAAKPADAALFATFEAVRSALLTQTAAAGATEPTRPIPGATAETPTPATVLLTLTANTHCRSGPSGAYDLVATYLAGQIAEASARSTVADYWYVPNPEQPGEFCWLWDQYATISGDGSVLPAYTPLPSPTPGPAFALSFSRLLTCGDIHAVFKVTNTSPSAFLSAERSVLDLETGTYLAAPGLDPSPFAKSSSECPIGTGSRLDPGQVGYVYVPLNPVPSGDSARGTLRLCTQAGLGGLCYAVSVNFEIP